MKLKIIAVALVIVIVIVALFATGAIAIGGNKVTVSGTVYYDVIGGWGVTYDSHSVEEDALLGTLWYWPWETKDIEAVVELTDDEGNKYSSSDWTTKINLLVGSAGFTVYVRHVPFGDYAAKISVYEVEKGVLLGEKNRVLQATSSFSLTV